MKQIKKAQTIALAVILIVSQFSLAFLMPSTVSADGGCLTVGTYGVCTSCINPGPYGICPPNTGIIITDKGAPVNTVDMALVLGIGAVLIANGVIIRKRLNKVN